MMIRFKVCKEPHFLEAQGREDVEIRSLGRKHASISNFPGS